MANSDFRMYLNDKYLFWELEVPKGFKAYCKNCLSEIDLLGTFYFCKDYHIFWCVDCRTENWGFCNVIDEHEHNCIKKTVEVEL